VYTRNKSVHNVFYGAVGSVVTSSDVAEQNTHSHPIFWPTAVWWRWAPIFQ